MSAELASASWEEIQPADWASIEHLELTAGRIVDGLLAGRHRSRLLSGTSEFAEHRAYSPGDEVRLIDWKVYGKKDRYFIRKYYDQTCLQTVVVLDASGSMAFGLGSPRKLDYARGLSLCLARLIIRQADAVGLAVLGTELRDYLPARARADHFHALKARLAFVQAEGETTLAENIVQLTRRIKRRGLLLLMSDCFDDLEGLEKALGHVRARGHELILFHIMAPEEIDFDFGGWSCFECLETPGQKLDLDPRMVRKEYLKNVEAFLASIRRVCREAGCDYVPMRTDRPMGEAVSRYLKDRSARIKH